MGRREKIPPPYFRRVLGQVLHEDPVEKLLEDNGRAGPCETCEHRQSETLDTQQAGMQCASGLSLCVRHRTWLVRALEHDCTGARWAETPSILGDDGPVRCVPFLPVLR